MAEENLINKNFYKGNRAKDSQLTLDDCHIKLKNVSIDQGLKIFRRLRSQGSKIRKITITYRGGCA